MRYIQRENNGDNKGTVVFYAVEGFGHINPLLQIGIELRRRGYRVVLLTTFAFAWSSRIKEMGLELEQCVSSDDEERKKMFRKTLDHMVETEPLPSFQGMFKKGGVFWSLMSHYIENEAAIEEKLTSLKPDLLVYDHMFGLPCLTQVAPRYVRAFSGFPTELFRCFNDNCVAGLGLKLDEMTPEMKKVELDTTRELRQRIRQHWNSRGYTDWQSQLDYSPTSPQLNFYFGPQEIGLENVPTFKPLPDNWFRLEHIMTRTETTREFQMPECLAKLPGKLIYFSLGSACICNQTGVDAQNRILRILSKSPHRFIVSKGQLHEQVDLFITHGGHNSIMEAFYFGVPAQIVLPIAADQFDCAQRIEDCGYGKRLHLYECTPDELLGAIETLLADQELRQRMKAIGSRLRSIDYVKIAADKLSDLMGNTDKSCNSS